LGPRHACLSEDLVYAADELNWRIHRLTLHPDKAAEAAAVVAQK
jgi:hypothetical protein